MKWTTYSLIVLLLYWCITHATDNAQFFKAPHLPAPPRFEKPYLGSIDIVLGSGSTQKSRNGTGKEARLFDLYGTHNIQRLTKGVTTLDPTDPLDTILLNLNALPSHCCFGHISLGAQFTIRELQLSYTQNFDRGFFSLIHIPIRSIKIERLIFHDLSSSSGAEPNSNTPEWQAFLRNRTAIFARHNLCLKPYDRVRVGGITILGGWTCNYQNTKAFDFIDTTLQIGFMGPTRKQKIINQPLVIPYGHNGHWAIPISWDGSIGLYEWLTCGAHCDALVFNQHIQQMRIKSAIEQTGLLFLDTQIVRIQKGAQLLTSLYIAADHFFKNLSMTLGYSYAHKTKDTLHPCNALTVDTFIINTDTRLKGWDMHTIHFFCEYDFTKEQHRIGPRLGLLFNWNYKGKRVFKTNTASCSCGLDITWRW